MCTAASSRDLEQLLQTSLAQQRAKTPNQHGITRHTRLIVLQPAEELLLNVFTPTLQQFFIAEVEGVFQVDQTEHEPR
jgi:hypothetical protein